MARDAPPEVEGLALSGGEPFEQAPAVRSLVRRVRRLRPTWSVFAWTGYTVGELMAAGGAKALLLREVDVLVDGPFVQGRARPGLLWRGSANQRVQALTLRGVELLARGPGAEIAVAEWHVGTTGTYVVTGFPPPETEVRP